MNQYILPQSIANCDQRKLYQFAQLSPEKQIVQFLCIDKYMIGIEINGMCPQEIMITINAKTTHVHQYIPENQHYLIEIELEEEECQSANIVIEADFKGRPHGDSRLILYC